MKEAVAILGSTVQSTVDTKSNIPLLYVTNNTTTVQNVVFIITVVIARSLTSASLSLLSYPKPHKCYLQIMDRFF